MLPDKHELEIFKHACANISLLSDSAWTQNDPDAFVRCNQNLWINFCFLNKRASSAGDSSCGDMAKTVREVIPESRLARCYGEFQYDVARERLYAQDEFTLPMQSSENEQRLATEPWMRADVEREFERLMRPPEVVLTCAWESLSNEESRLRERVYSTQVRAIWERVSAPRQLSADVPEFRPQPTPLPGFFPSAAAVAGPELFPYHQQCRTIPVYQRPPELYDASRRRVSPQQGADHSNLILLTRGSGRGRDVGGHKVVLQAPQQVQWISVAYPDRYVELRRIDSLERKFLDVEGFIAQRQPPSPLEMSQFPPVTEDLAVTTPLPQSTRRLYRDVVVSSGGRRSSLPPHQIPSDNGLERRLQELEIQAVEQYQASEENLDQRFRELEEQAAEQYRSDASPFQEQQQEQQAEALQQLEQEALDQYSSSGSGSDSSPNLQTDWK